MDVVASVAAVAAMMVVVAAAAAAAVGAVIAMKTLARTPGALRRREGACAAPPSRVRPLTARMRSAIVRRCGRVLSATLQALKPFVDVVGAAHERDLRFLDGACRAMGVVASQVCVQNSRMHMCLLHICACAARGALAALASRERACAGRRWSA